MQHLALNFCRTLFAAALGIVCSPLLPAAAGEALPLVSPMFGDHMVLQRGKPNRLWGWTTPGTDVRVQVGDASATARAAADGRWQAEFQPPPAGGPYEIHIDGPQSESVVIRDVLVGDVWLCGGQSNMEFGLGRSLNGTEEVERADQPRIRFFRVAPQPAYAAAAAPQGTWTVCAPDAFGFGNGGFSAVAYFFARRLQQDVDVPIGLIQDAVGGTPAETWMSPAALQAFPEFAPALAEIERLRSRGGPVHGNYIMHWYDEYDIGLQGATWAAEAFDDATWKGVSLKTGFADLGVPDTPAVCWFRREIELPDPLPAGVARLQLGVVEKMDTAHINGRWIGASAWVENPRNYAIGEGVLRPGRNLIAIRVLKLKPDGGFQSDAEKIRLVLGDRTAIPLEGAWRGAVSVDARPPHPLPLGYDNWPTMPAVLNFGMIQPVAPLALKGVLWYQGEANFTRAHQYRALLPAMIADWRTAFGQGELPFYIAQLPAYMARKADPGDDWWAELREAQALAARTVKNAALAVTIDTGEADDIHPKEKKPVGERLALLALRGTYGRTVVASGPEFAALEPLPGALRIRFANTDGGLVVKGERAGEFAIAGADRAWHWADARIEGDTIVVSSPQVAQPVAVRYAWQANPLATLFNGAGLPAAPFRTDDWPLSTEGRK